MAENLFGDEQRSGRVNPFGDEPEAPLPGDAAVTIEHAAQKIRALRSQVGADGLTLSATKELIDQLSKALDAAARALRGME